MERSILRWRCWGAKRGSSSGGAAKAPSLPPPESAALASGADSRWTAPAPAPPPPLSSSARRRRRSAAGEHEHDHEAQGRQHARHRQQVHSRQAESAKGAGRAGRGNAGLHPPPEILREAAVRHGSVGLQRQRELLQLASCGIVVRCRAAVERGVDRAAGRARSWWCRSGGVIAGLSQLRQGAVQSRSGVGLGHAEHPCDLRVGKATRELEGDQVALLAVERGHRGAHHLAAQGQLGVVLREGAEVSSGSVSRLARRFRRRSSSSAALRAMPNNHASMLPAGSGSSIACGRRARRPGRSHPRPPSGHARATPRRRTRAETSARRARRKSQCPSRLRPASAPQQLRSRPHYERASSSSRPLGLRFKLGPGPPE